MRAVWLSLFAVVACGGSHQANQAPPSGAAGAGNKAGAAGSAGMSGSGGRAGASSGGTGGNAGASDEAGSSNGDVGGAGALGGGGTSGTGGKGGSSGSGGKGGTSGTGGSSSGTGGTGGTEPLEFSTFEPADVVIGQKDFVSNAKASKVGAAVLDYAAGSAAFDGKRLFVSDTYAERVLGFSSLPSGNGASAKLVLGQASVSASAAGTSLANLYQPQALHTDGTTLAIADAGNHRVLLLPVGSSSGSAAGIVVGWPDGVTPSQGCSSSLLRSPASAFIAKGKLLVADRANNRVLVWNSVPASNGAAADIVLGQSSMTSCVANDSLQNGTVGLRSASTLRGPTDVWTDGTSVLVADRDNNRVLIWTSFPAESGAAADWVIGQASFGTARDDASASVVERPSALAYAGDVLFIADSGHNRVLGWSSFPATSGAAADLVFGQHDFKHVAANDDAQAGHDGSAPTARTLAFPTGVAFAGASLVVSDSLNRRVLVFQKH